MVTAGLRRTMATVWLLALRLALAPGLAVAEPVTVEGTLDVVVEDRATGATLLYSVNAAGRRYFLDVPDGVPIGQAGSRVRVRGTRTGQRVAVDEVLPLASDEAASRAAGPLAAAASPSGPTGLQRTLVLLLNFTAYPDQPFTTAQVRDAVFDAPTSMNAFYRENSFDQVHFAGDVVGWLTLPGTPPNCDGFALLDDALDAADPMVNFTQYDRLILVSPAIRAVAGCPIEGGFATLGQTAYPTPDGVAQLSVSWIYDFSLFVLEHEMGHNLGVMHANRLECPTERIDSTCTHREYQDPFDVMGTNAFHLNAAHKERLGWLLPANVAAATGDGTFALQALESPTGGVQAVKIQAPSPGSSVFYYYVEHREPEGFDAGLAGYPTVLAGAQVRRACAGCPDTELIATPKMDINAAIAPGDAFTLDGPHPLFLTPLGVTGGHLDVRLRHFELPPVADADGEIGALLALRVPARDLLGHALALSMTGAPAGATLHLLGDANLDGVLTSADASLAASLASAPGGTEEQRALADVDGDGAVTGADASAIGAVVGGTAPPLNTGVLLWRPTVSQCGAYPVTFTVTEGAQSMSRMVTVAAGRPRNALPLPDGWVWGHVKITVETGCPAVDLSIAGGPAQPMPRSGALWDTTTIADGSYQLRATVGGNASTVWTVTVENQPPMLQLQKGSFKYSGPTRPSKLTVSGTLGFPGVVPTSLPQGGTPWIVAVGRFGFFEVTGLLFQVVCNPAGSSCRGEIAGDIGPAGSRSRTLVRLTARDGLVRFRITGRDVGVVTALPDGDALVDVGFCFGSLSPCLLPRIQFRRQNATTYALRKLH